MQLTCQCACQAIRAGKPLSSFTTSSPLHCCSAFGACAGAVSLRHAASPLVLQAVAGLPTANSQDCPPLSLLQCIDDLREKREEVQKQIQNEEGEKAKIQQDLQVLTKRLSHINDSLARKVSPAEGGVMINRTASIFWQGCTKPLSHEMHSSLQPESHTAGGWSAADWLSFTACAPNGTSQQRSFCSPVQFSSVQLQVQFS